jgi:FtsP/CotA-like multicopper oxidase with cupredoxin domain
LKTFFEPSPIILGKQLTILALLCPELDQRRRKRGKFPRSSTHSMLLLAALATLASLTNAAALPSEDLIPSPIEKRDAACTHGPTSRACWSNGYSIATDFDLKFPVTGAIVRYNLVITNGTCNPDGGGERECFLVNGQYPGPQITANWGDRLQLTVQNNLANNGTAMHWHGVRQYNSVGSDGVGGITECPIAPGTSKTYDFLVTQFGTSWYHSHFSSQYGDGIVGPLVFNGPATANYDIDLGPYALTDW